MKKLNFQSYRQLYRDIIKKYIIYFFILLVIILLHTIVVDIIAIEDITPDLFLIFVVWLTLKEGTYFGLFAGFFIGLLFDTISADIIGTNALSKTVVAFITGFFYKERNDYKIIQNYKFILIVLFTTIIHNLIYFFFYIKTSEQNFMLFYLKYGIASAFYTTFFAALVFLFQIPSNRIKI